MNVVASSKSANLPWVIAPKRHLDQRGWFSEIFRENRLFEVGISSRFVQENQSFSKRAGTLRGLHFQLPPQAQAKLVTVIQGRIMDVVVDIRSGSPTYGRYVSLELSAESGYLLYVPVGFAHGFLTLEDDAIVNYKVSDYYSLALDSGIRWNDPDIAISWPVQDSRAMMSDKDRNLPLLKELASPFRYDGNPLDPSAVKDLWSL